MNKTILGLALASLVGVSAYAQSPLGDLSVSGTVGYESQYVFRGKKITNSAFQPKAEFGMPLMGGNLYGGVWTNQPISRRTAAGGPDQSDEIDLYAGFIYPLMGGLSIDVGNTYYWYPEAGGNSAPTPTSSPVGRSDETYLGLSLDSSAFTMGYNFNPSIYVYHDWFLDSNVAEVSAKYTWDISNVIGISGVSLVPRIYGGWSHTNRTWGDQIVSGIPGNPRPNWRNSYFYYGASAELDYKVSDFCTIYGSVSYAGNNDGKVGAPAVVGNPQLGGTANSAWFGAGVKFSR